MRSTVPRHTTVRFTAPVESIEYLDVYGPSSRVIGRAFSSSADPSLFTLTLTADLTVDQREDYPLYVRPALKAFAEGGKSGEELAVEAVTVKGTGQWSEETISQSSTATFSSFETARSTFTSIENAGPDSAALTEGQHQEIGSWRFEAVRGDSLAEARLTGLTFTLGLSGVSASNLALALPETNERAECSLSGTQVHCDALPASLGSLNDHAVTLRLTADVTLTSSNHASLQVSLGDGGSIDTPGAVAWSDGTTEFSWVPFGPPVAGGTHFTR